MSTDRVVVKGHYIAFGHMVETLIKKFPDRPSLEFCHAAMGVTGEAGELSDAIKRHVIYEKDADLANIIEELGDLEFYMENIRTLYGITRQQTLQGNADKLGVRYAGLVYSDQAAINRADKREEPSGHMGLGEGSSV